MVAESCDPGAACKAKSVPVPERAIVCGLLAVLSVMESCPLRLPACVGVKVTAILHCPPAATEEQLFVCVKSPVALAETVRAAVPVLPRTTLVVLLAVFTS
jgi:hypothetical protein